MDAGDAQHILRSNALSEIYAHKDNSIVEAWHDCVCDNPTSCVCRDPAIHQDVQDFNHARPAEYGLQIQGSARRPRELSLRGLEIYSAQAAITRDRNRHWPEPTPFFREYLRHFKHNPVEWRSPRYRAYRDKQSNIIEKKKPNPWPEDIEHHFQRALQLFGGCGRDKEDLGGKLSGCNEWMAWCIFVETGVELHRKKVSSHIQVLKGKLSDNDEWMHFARPSLDAAKKESNERTARRRNGTHQVPVPQSYNSSVQRPMQAVSMHDQKGFLPSHSFLGPKVHTATFTMYWFDISDETDQSRGQPFTKSHDSSTQHIYTELQSDVPTRPQGFHDMQEWRSRFPSLQFFGENGCPTPTYLFDAGLKFKDSFSEKNAVVTDLDVCLLHSEGYTNWTTCTQIHEEENKLEGCPTKQPTEKKGQHTILRCINLETKYWAQLFSLVGARIGAARAKARETGVAATLEDEQRNVQTFLGNLYLSQQMWATCEKSGKQKCFAIFLWRFHMVGPNIAATTNWRPLHFDQAQMPAMGSQDDVKGLLLGDSDSKALVETDSSHRMQLRCRDDLWDSGRCWKEGSSQLLAKDFASFPSAESSPTTDLTTDAGSSIFSSASASFATSNPPADESFSQATTQDTFEPYDMASYCESFESSQNHEPSTWFQAPLDQPKADGAILQVPECSPYDTTIEQLSMPSDQYHNIFGQLLDTKPLILSSTPHTGTEAQLSSVRQGMLTPNACIPYGEQDHRISGDENIHIALQYSQASEQDAANLDHHKSPLAGPQSRMPNLLEGYILQFEQAAQRQQQCMEQQQQSQQQPYRHHPSPHSLHRQQHDHQQQLQLQDHRIEELSDDGDALDPGMIASVEPSQASEGTLPRDNVDLQQELERTPHINASNLSLDWQSITYSGPPLPSNADSPAYISRYAEPTAATEGFHTEVHDWQFVDVGEGLRQEEQIPDELA